MQVKFLVKLFPYKWDKIVLVGVLGQDVIKPYTEVQISPSKR